MELKIFGYDVSFNKKTIKPETKSYVSSGYSSLSEALSGNTISTQTFYDLYKKNADIRQSIRKIASTVSRNGIFLTDNDGEVIEDGEFVDSVYEQLKAPTFMKFKLDVFRNYLLSGDLYIVPARNLKGNIIAFEVLDSRSMAKRVDKSGNIVGFKQYSKTGESKSYTIDQVAYFQLEQDVMNANLGMGLLHGVVYDALSDLEAMKTNYVLYQNNSVPNSILLLDGELSENEMEIAKEQFEMNYKGTQNAHKMLIGGGIKDIKQLSISPRDMEFLNQRKMTTEKVSAVFGVPKSILGYVDSVNYANAKELRKEYLEGTIRPYEQDFEHILNVLSSKFIPELYEKYWIKCDGEQLDETDAIYENQRKDVERGILTINEIRQQRGLGEFDTEDADKPVVSRNMVLLEDIALDATLSPNEE